MTRPVGVGVIGAGYWGTKVAQEYLLAERNKGNVKFVKICDSSPTAVLKCERRLSIAHDRTTEKVEELLEDPEIAAIHIATPNPTHYSLAKRAMEARKNVLIEKPMTLNSSEAYELVDIATSQELVLHVGQIFRFNSALQKARQLLRDRTVGKIFYVRIQWTDSAFYPERDIIFDLGPHPIDILNFLLDDWPKRVSGFARGFRNLPGHEEVAYAVAEFSNDVFAHVELSWLHPKKTRDVTIVGSQATLHVDCLEQRLARFSDGDTQQISVSANNTIESEIDHFVECVTQRSISRESGLIGVLTVEALENIRRSMQQRPVTVPFGLTTSPH